MNVHHTIVVPIAHPNDVSYQDQHTGKLIEAFPGVELGRKGHELVVTFALPLDVNFHSLADPEDEWSPIAVLTAIGFDRAGLVTLCQRVHRHLRVG